MNYSFDIISCSWPRPVQVVEGCWASEPQWDAPLMPVHPTLRPAEIDGEECRLIDWREMFKSGLRFWTPRPSGEMRGFHVVFRVRINGSGVLVFWSDDGCIIRRGEEIIHSDRTAHMPARSEIAVSAGDLLAVAQWQRGGEWMWGARLIPSETALDTPIGLLLRHLGKVENRLKHPAGPPLKMYFSASSPFRTVLALYSMILNGYAPSEVFLFGEYQWSDESRKLFGTLLPFAHIVPTDEVLRRIESVGHPQLVATAGNHWFVMKLCIGLLCPPNEFCFMDDDVFVLDSIDDALRAFADQDLVFAPDADYGEAYLSTWGCLRETNGPLPTGTINTGLYCLRNKHDARKIAYNLMRAPIDSSPGWLWEQGFMACEFGSDSSFRLPSQRYFYPYFDGLPAGLSGYDYARNPCGFVSIHFGGLAEKPSDATALALAPEVLGRHE